MTTKAAIAARWVMNPRVTRCEPSDADLLDMAEGRLDDPGYRVESEVASSSHFVDLEGGAWQVVPAQAPAHLTVEAARVYMRELRIAVDAAVYLNGRRPKPVDPAHAAITAEVLAVIGDRGWSIAEAAEQFGIKKTTLVHRIGGHSGWAVRDLADIAAAISDDDDSHTEWMCRLIGIGSRRPDPVEGENERPADMWTDLCLGNQDAA